MADKVLDVAKLTLTEYVEARMSRLSESARAEFSLNTELGRGQIAHLFSMEYIQARHVVLEQNCLQLYRRYLAALRALESEVGSQKAVEKMMKSLETVPEKISEIPGLK